MTTTMNSTAHEQPVNAVERVPNLTTAALQLLLEALFPLKQLPCSSLQLARSFIAAFITANGNHYANYAAFCQRVLMARHYFLEENYVPPGLTLLNWLDPENPNGFAGTEAWFARLQEKRKKTALHLLELKAIPEAMMEMIEEGSTEIYQYWYHWFQERGNTDPLLMWKMLAGSLFFNGHCKMAAGRL